MNAPETRPRVIRFGVFELDRRAGELRKEGVRVRLQEQPLRVLDALLAEPGEPVTREALRERLWPHDTFVDFGSGLNRAISRLRAALKDEADNPRFIETLDRRGYRFIAPVTVAAAGPATPTSARREPTPETALPVEPLRSGRTAWLGPAVAVVALLALLLAPALWRKALPADAGQIRSLAVLPLANLIGDPAQEYFSDGMTDALITNLASLPALRVISRQSVMRFKGSAKPLPEIARELGVEGVVEGSVARSGGRVRITAQLVHAATDRHLWARADERPSGDVLAQGELARAIAAAVRVTVSAEESHRLTSKQAVNPDAYDAYLLGRHHFNQRTGSALDKAVTYFQAATAIDPGFALAHAGVAQAYGSRAMLGYVPPGRELPALKAAARRALELDPRLGEAHAAMATAHLAEWDWEGAELQFRIALEADPNSSLAQLWYSRYLHARARFEEGLAHRRKALELDPLDVVVNKAVATELGAIGRDAEALAQWSRTLELAPDRAPTHRDLGLYHIARGRNEAGLEHLRRARALAPHDPTTLAALAFGLAVSGDAPEARRRLGELEAESARRYISPVLSAYVHAALGRRGRAFALLEQAHATKDPLLIPLQADTRSSALRADPRFGDLLRRMGFAPPRPPAPQRRSTPREAAARVRGGPSGQG